MSFVTILYWVFIAYFTANAVLHAIAATVRLFANSRVVGSPLAPTVNMVICVVLVLFLLQVPTP